MTYKLMKSTRNLDEIKSDLYSDSSGALIVNKATLPRAFLRHARPGLMQTEAPESALFAKLPKSDGDMMISGVRVHSKSSKRE